MSRTEILSKSAQLAPDRLPSSHLQWTPPSLGAPVIRNKNTCISADGAGHLKLPMVKTLWDELSDQEKADCVDRLWEKKFNSQYRWDVKGRLRDEIWAQKTLPLLNRLENENYSEIYGAGNKHMMRALHISLLGQTDDSRTAHPAVLIVIDVRKLGQRMKHLFENHQQFQDLNTGLRIEAIDTPKLRLGRLFRFPAAEDEPSTERPGRGLYDSLCGAGVLVTKLPPTEESLWKRATVGGVICNPKTKEYFAVTVAHCFNFGADANSVDSSDDESGDSTILSQQSDTSNTSFRAISGDEPSDVSERALRTRWLPNAICGAYIDAEDDRSFRRTKNLEQQQERPQSLAYVGDIDLRLNHSDPATSSDSSSQYFMDLDWALIRVRDPRFMQRNQISTPWNTKLCPASILLNSYPPGPQAILAAQTSGARKVDFSGTESSVRFPWATTAHRLWTLEAELAQGDSGSWVLSTDGTTVYGMVVVASVPLLNIVYVIRAEDLFESILSNWPCKVTIHDMLPTNELKDLDVVLKSGSAAHAHSVQLWTNEQTSLLRDSTLSRTAARQMGPHPGFSDPGLGSDFSNALANASPFAEIGQLERQLYDEIKILRLRDRLPEAVVRFTEIVRGDHEACKNYVGQHPKVLEFDEARLIQEAIKAYRKRYLVFTHACVERAIVIRHLKRNDTSDTAQDLFERLAQDDQATTETLQKSFDAALKKVHAMGNTIDEGKDAHIQPSGHYGRVETDSNLTRPSVPKGRNFSRDPHDGERGWKISEIANIQARGSSYLRYEALRGEQDAEATVKQSLSENASNASERDIRTFPVAGSSDLRTLDPKFFVHISSFYKVGTVFAVLSHEEAAASRSGRASSARTSYPDSYTTQGAFGERIYSTIRRLIVVREAHGYSVCVPIMTYGGRALLKRGLSESDVSRHAVAYAAGTQPCMLEGEPKLSTKPISIDTQEDERLDKASRIFFAKLYTVEHNVKSKYIGRVSQGSMPYFQAYVRESFALSR